MRKFSILLTDDEKLALAGLEKGVEWKSLNVDRLYKCLSADTAIQLLKREQVDIVLRISRCPTAAV